MKAKEFWLRALGLPLIWLALVGAVIQSGTTADIAHVDTNKNLRINLGPSSRPTYIASVSAQATTAAIILSIESSSGTGFKLASWCVGITNATAAAGVTVSVQRRTTASSGGTALAIEGTTATSISKMDPADGNYGGIARLGGTPGTAGPMLDQHSFQVGELGAGTADGAGVAPFCQEYGTRGDKMPTVLPGVGNGLTINVSAAGAGGLAFGSIRAKIIAE